MITIDPMNDVLPAAPGDHGVRDAESSLSEVVTVIRPRPGWIAINWEELAQAHELFVTLVARDLMVRYKQTVLGVAWAVLQPVLTMLVFWVIFGLLLKVKTGVVPYALFAYAALVPWMFFANAVTSASQSLLVNQNLLTKIYFPRLYVPGATIGGALVDMFIGLGLLAILMPAYHYGPTWNLLALPLVVVLAFAATLGAGLALAALTLLYRDLRFVIPFALQIMIYASGVQIPLEEILPRPYQLVVALNPMYGIIGGFRSAILGLPWDFATLAISTLSSAALLTFGLFFFRKTERLFADIA
jgi:lipopolysaccharide transport system permease protein